MTYVMIIIFIGTGVANPRSMAAVPGYTSAAQCWTSAAETLAAFRAKGLGQIDVVCIPGPQDKP